VGRLFRQSPILFVTREVKMGKIVELKISAACCWYALAPGSKEELRGKK
jgi:hypothetical protein